MAAVVNKKLGAAQNLFISPQLHTTSYNNIRTEAMARPRSKWTSSDEDGSKGRTASDKDDDILSSDEEEGESPPEGVSKK